MLLGDATGGLGLFPLLALALGCVAGCGVGHDAGALSERRVGGERVQPAVGEYSLFGLHRDRGPDERRALRAEHLTVDRKTRPTVREQRIARTMAEAEERLVRQGGMMPYRWDGTASKPTAVKFVASPGALTLEYRASKKLNGNGEREEPFPLVIYHLSDLAALNQLSGHEDGIRKLLEGERFDESVKRVRTVCIEPGSEGKLLFDRPEGGRYVAIVAGFSRPDRKTSLYVTEYGIGHWERPANPKSFYNRNTDMFAPMPLTISMSLSASEMTAKHAGKMFGHLQKTRDLQAREVQYMTFLEYMQLFRLPESAVYDDSVD